MANNRNSYGSILKSIGLFGGVQVFNILVGIVKNKFVAILLGPSGMGVVGMITSATNLVETFTGFGLRTSATRNIANATSSNDDYRIGRVLAIIRRLVILTGLLGTVVVFLLAKQLSIWSFGNEAYTTAFQIVSVTAFLNQICIGQTTLMQGTFHYKLMAKSSLWGSVIGLVISVPLYYLWGEKAIVPVIVISSVTSLLLSTFYSKKISYQRVKVNNQEVWKEGKGILELGLAIALTGAAGIGATYIVRAFISNTGSIADVGLYSAGIALCTMYVNTILNAMSSDYSPRLASMSNDRIAFIETINRQLKLMVTIMVPMIILFIIVIRELTILLYSEKFLPVTTMIEWMMAGMLFRATSWCMSFAQVARGDSKIFFWNELIASIYSIVFSIVGFYYLRFDGLGIAFLLNYLTYSIQMYILSHRRFQYRISRDTLSVIAQNIAVLVVVFLTMRLLKYTIWRYVVGLVLMIGALWLAYYNMNKMIPVKDSVRSILNRFKNNK